MGNNGRPGDGAGITALTLIRHGESEGNLAATQAREAGALVIKVPARDADVGLSETGRDQALALGRFLAGVLLDERLRDRELGILDMLTSAGVEARFPEEAERRRWLGKFYYRPPGGESWADVVLRLRSLLADLDRRHPGEEVVLVCHDALILLFRYVLQGLTEADLLDLAATTSILNASVSRFVRADGTGPWQLAGFNQAEHLMAHGVPVTEHAGDANVHPR